MSVTYCPEDKLSSLYTPKARNMIYEIFKVQNGYVVRPTAPAYKGDYVPVEQCYVFNDYSKMADKLHELLDSKPEQLNDSLRRS